MAQLVQHGLGAPRGARSHSLEFRLIFGVSFLVFLVAAVAGRLLPGQAHKEARQPPRSVLAEARAAAHTFVPMVFMG
ncbi:MAG: hypothetical protein WHV64_05325 [Geminicoccaceae bacterium]|jgi:hypothetical protein